MQALRIFSDTQKKLEFVLRYGDQMSFDFLETPRSIHDPVELLVTQDRLASFKEALHANEVEFEVFEDDMSKKLQLHMWNNRQARMRRGSNAFPQYEEVRYDALF